MGQILHGSARTTEAARRAIQHSQESLKVLAVRYGINEKTVAKWRKRDYVDDAQMGPKEPASTVLLKEEEAICVAFRKHTLLPLDDCLVSSLYSYRHHPATQVYEGISSADNHVYFMKQADGLLRSEGPLVNWLPVSGCQ